MEKLLDLDTLIVTELSRLGRSTAEVIELINELIRQNIRVIIIKQNLDIKKHDMNGPVANFEFVKFFPILLWFFSRQEDF